MDMGLCGRTGCPLKKWLAGNQKPPLNGSVTLGAAITELLAAKKAANRRPLYVESLGYYLGRFKEGLENAAVVDIATSDILIWLSQFPDANSRSTWLNRISSLFAYCKRRGYVATNICDPIERPTIDPKAIRILTPDEADRIIAACPAKTLPYLVVCLFCGVRPQEAMRLDWSAVDLDEKRLVIGSQESKVRRRRLVPIPDRALALLAGVKDRRGPIAPSVSTVRRWKRAARKLLGWWEADCLRHTAISYQLAFHEDIGKVSTHCGTSPGIIKKHYDGMASRSAASKFLGLA